MRHPLTMLHLAASRIAAPVAALVLKHRARRGKEDRARIGEKRGEPFAARPHGRLIHVHAVGVGEAMAMLTLIRRLLEAERHAHVLLTTSARTSAEALAGKLPERCIHQFLPFDVARWRRKFLDHWRPDLTIWSERDFWTGFLQDLAARGVPQALVNGRMTVEAAAKKKRFAGYFRDQFRQFALSHCQESESAARFEALGAQAMREPFSLKRCADPLPDIAGRRQQIEAALNGLSLFLAASTHAGEEEVMLDAFAAFRRDVLVIAPRYPDRAAEIAALATTQGHSPQVLSGDALPAPDADVLIIGEVGQLGTWYRIADVAFIGGSLVPVGGHNPWEAVKLGCAALHGPQVQNFAADYEALSQAGAAQCSEEAAGLASVVRDQSALDGLRANGQKIADADDGQLDGLVTALLALLNRNHG